jgi:hypothetical protein
MKGIALFMFVPIVLVIFGLTTVSYGQNSQSAKSSAKSQSQPASPVTMTECEGTNNCATWTFLGTQGNGQWPSGEIANLSVQRFDDNSVVIHRADSTGSSAGLTATYTGKRHDDRIGGEFTSSWPGHWDSKSGNWYATIEKIPQGLPRTMRVCANPNDWSVCSTWTWVNGHYDGWREWGAIATMTVESFTRDSVVIRRADTGPPGPGHPGAGFTMVYRGTISSQGNSILDGVSTANNGSVGPFRAYWGEPIRDLPSGPNRALRPVVVCYPWFFGVVCSH